MDHHTISFSPLLLKQRIGPTLFIMKERCCYPVLFHKLSTLSKINLKRERYPGTVRNLQTRKSTESIYAHANHLETGFALCWVSRIDCLPTTASERLTA